MKLCLPLVSALALAIVAFDAATPALAQQMGAPAQCGRFGPLNTATQAKANAVQAAMKAKADRKDICRLMTAFVASEGSIVKFLIDNQTWCNIPAPVVAAAKTSHEKSVKFREVVCTEAPEAKAPTLSDAIKTTPVDSGSNTKTGPGGTFDTLTGNPLGR
ncbi:MAG TPA: hypothetical protein VHY10_16900 [Xanthobacteraceae bacterium]|jgi:hypothetical protein|nr:hypothetical protein [Xanthobacteraceae bacterium]